MAHEMIVTISKGLQVTIPAFIREDLGLHSGSKLEMEQKGKKIVLKPVGDDLEQIFKETKHLKPKFNLTAKQMDELNEKMFR